MNPAAAPEVLARLSRDPVHWVRYEVAANPATEQEMLTVMADDPNPQIHLALAINPSTPAEVLSRFGSHNERAVRTAAAHNPAHPGAEDPVDVDGVFEIVSSSATASRRDPFRLGFRPVGIVAESRCGQKVRRTGLTCLLVPDHKGHCRSILVAAR